MLTARRLHLTTPCRPAAPLLNHSSLDDLHNNSIGDEEEEVDDNDILGDGAEGVSRTADGAAGDTDELPAELRMDDYDDEPGLNVTAARGEDDEEGSDSDNDDGAADGDADAMDEDSDDDEGGDGEDDNAEAMGVSLLEEPSTGQVFAYESEGEDSDTEDNIIKPGDHVLLTASTEEVCRVQVAVCVMYFGGKLRVSTH